MENFLYVESDKNLYEDFDQSEFTDGSNWEDEYISEGCGDPYCDICGEYPYEDSFEDSEAYAEMTAYERAAYLEAAPHQTQRHQTHTSVPEGYEPPEEEDWPF